MFSYTGMNIYTKEVKQFYIYEGHNDLINLMFYILDMDAMIGFNNLNYDYPILHYLLTNIHALEKLSVEKLLYLIYKKSQEIINSEYSSIRDKDVKVAQIDLYRIHHFDNAAKRTSLKDLEIVMGFERVEDLPFKYNHVVQPDEIETILDYNLNDVKATLDFYKLSLEAIRLRQSIGKKYGLSLINANDPKIGSEIFGKFIAQEKGIPLYELKQMKTNRSSINLGECILPYINFKSKEFNNLLNKLKNSTITKTKNSLEYSIIYKGFRYDFGTGGIHGCIKPGVYEEDKDNLIKSCDVTSLYPNISIKNNFYPKHIGPVFVKIYENIFNERDKAKQEFSKNKKLGKEDPVNKAINEGLKLALNGVYGKSNDEHSFFYDPMFTMQITVNGQLLLTMLAERLQDVGFQMLMINTDGLECVVPRNKVDIYDAICNTWMEETKLNLEFEYYKKLVIRDINNYIGIYTNDKVKYKGAFEISDQFHKNPSNKIVKLAIKNYFVDNIPIRDTILNHKNILDFCKRFKATYGWSSEVRTVNKDSTLTIQKCQKTNRYFICNNQSTYLKVHEDGRVSQIEAGWNVEIYNNHNSNKNIEDYNINYNYYIQECNKIIEVIENKQLQLF